MAAQTNYSYSTPKGVPGGKYDLACDEVKSRTNDEADGAMVFGIAVAVGANAGDSVKVPVEGTKKEDIEGIVLHSENTEQDMNGKVVIRKGVTLSVMDQGHCWGRLATGATYTYHKPAYVVVGGDESGYFTNTSGDNTVDIGAVFGSAVDEDNGIAVIEL